MCTKSVQVTAAASCDVVGIFWNLSNLVKIVLPSQFDVKPMKMIMMEVL
jgi:hypothetical protein